MSIDIVGVGKRFGRVQALASIDLQIEDGEFVALLGPSGCGKTTLLRLLAGFDRPTSGEIFINEKKMSDPQYVCPPEKRNIGMVFQSFALWPHMNVRDHIRFPLRHQSGVPKTIAENMEKRVDEVLDMVGLREFDRRMPAELSGGQKQRVALARAIAPEPSLLLMDEPLSSLDTELRMDLRREIQRLHRMTRASVLYVTHDQGEALAMADRIVVMKDGAVEQIGTPEEIYTRPKTEFVARFVGKANLFEGTWEKSFFYPAGAGDAVCWDGEHIDPVFKKQNVYPARPEQFRIAKQGPGLAGTVETVQYQGKEIHYTVRVEGRPILLCADIHERFSIGERVFLQFEHQHVRAGNRNLVFNSRP